VLLCFIFSEIPGNATFLCSFLLTALPFSRGDVQQPFHSHPFRLQGAEAAVAHLPLAGFPDALALVASLLMHRGLKAPFAEDLPSFSALIKSGLLPPMSLLCFVASLRPPWRSRSVFYNLFSRSAKFLFFFFRPFPPEGGPLRSFSTAGLLFKAEDGVSDRGPIPT